jgi:hypothetical protein
MRATEPLIGTDERALLLGWLAFHRDALEAKCAGLTGEQLTTCSTPPSRLTLLGLVRHMTEMERAYLSQCLTGQPYESLYCPDDDPEGDFETLDPARAGADIERWRQECGVSDDAIARFDAVDRKAPRGGTVASGSASQAPLRTVRWLLQKVIGEYARHNGHADLIREAIDGQTGE